VLVHSRLEGKALLTVYRCYSARVHRSDVMIVFGVTSLWEGGSAVAVHVNRVWFVFSTHTFLKEPGVMFLTFVRPRRGTSRKHEHEKPTRDNTATPTLMTTHLQTSLCQ
jgi:hypothetical protein